MDRKKNGQRAERERERDEAVAKETENEREKRSTREAREVDAKWH